MFYIVINSVLYLIALIFYWRYKRQIDLGFIILAAFTTIAILAIPDYYLLSFLYNRNITLLPFLYLFVVLVLFIRPYLNARGNLLNKIKVHSQRELELIAYSFIISSFLSVYILLPTTLHNIRSGDWNKIRDELYSGDISKSYSNFFERIILIYSQYLHLVGILIFFYFLTLKKYGKKFFILLGLSCVMPMLLVSINIASRGMLVNLFLEFIAAFVLFKNHLSISIKKKLFTSGIIFLFIFFLYSLSVTTSRFGVDSGYGSTNLTSNLSLLDYFGQPMLVFNDGVASMHNYANGKYFFKYIFDALNIDSNFDQKRLGAHYGSGFFTFVGGFYIDFGPFGTLLLALILPYLIKKSIKGKAIYFENLYLYYFFFIFFLEGVFVVGYSSILSWLFAILIYSFLKLKKS